MDRPQTGSLSERRTGLLSERRLHQRPRSARTSCCSLFMPERRSMHVPADASVLVTPASPSPVRPGHVSPDSRARSRAALSNQTTAPTLCVAANCRVHRRAIAWDEFRATAKETRGGLGARERLGLVLSATRIDARRRRSAIDRQLIQHGESRAYVKEQRATRHFDARSARPLFGRQRYSGRMRTLLSFE
jgi:hypothetical protein